MADNENVKNAEDVKNVSEEKVEVKQSEPKVKNEPKEKVVPSTSPAPKQPKVQKAPKVKKEKTKKSNGTIVVVLILIIIAMAVAFTYVIINREEIFDDAVSTSKKTSDDSDVDNLNDVNSNDNNSNSKVTAQEISEMLKKEGFSFSINISNDNSSVFAYGDNENKGIYIYLDILNNGKNTLSFRDSSIDSDGDYTYAYLTGEAKSSNSQKQQGLAEKWLKSHNISANELEKALEYIYQNKIYTAYHSYFKDDESSELSIVLNKDSITLPYKGISSTNLEVDEHLINYIKDESLKNELYDELTDIFVKSYSGGKLTVEEEKEINLNKIGEYPINFIVSSEKGSTKKATAKIIIVNVSEASISLNKENIKITKGTKVDIMDGVTISSDLPKSEQGHIETEGSVNVNKVGTYTITYTYVPKEGSNEITSGSKKRTYTVVESEETELSIKEYTPYTLKHSELLGELVFENHSFTLRRRLSKFRWCLL